MSYTPTSAPPETLLGHSPDELALRIRGTRRDGQIVRLRSTKITIGSSPRCTLRLRGPGIAPLHCLILRGNQHTVVRRWDRDTRLNDYSFDDATLVAGDCLSVGPFGLEVVQTEISSASPDKEPPHRIAAAESAPTVQATSLPKRQSRRRARWLIQQLRRSRSRTGELEQMLASHQQQARDFQRHQIQWENVIKALEEQLLQSGDQRTADENLFQQKQAELDERTGQLAFEQKSLAARRNALDEERSALVRDRALLDSQRVAAQEQQQEFTQQHRQQESTIQQRLAELHELESTLQYRESELEGQEAACRQQELTLQQRENAVGQRTLHLETQVQDLAHRESDLTKKLAALNTCQHASVDTDALQSQLAADTKQLAALQTQLAEHQAELSQQRKQLEQQAAQFAARQEQLNQQATESAAAQQKVLAAQQQLATDRQKLETERNQLSSENSQLQAKLQQESSALEQLQEEQTARERRWHEQCNQREAALAQQAQSLEERAAKIESDCQELLRQQNKLQQDRQTWQQQAGQQQQSMRLTPSEDQTDRTATAKPDGHKTAEPAEPTLSADVVEDQSKSDDDVFARLRALALLKDSTPSKAPDHASIEKEDPQLDPPSTEAGAKLSAGEQSSVAEEDPDAALQAPDSSPEEDVSIDDYMAKLLERMRGPSTGDPAPTKRAPKVVEENSPKPTIVKPQPTAETPIEPAKPAAVQLAQLEPRKAAPENTRDLAAMREIANLSARTAIATHHHRRRASRAWTTLAVGAVCLICGAFLVWWAAPSSPLFYIGLIGIVAALGCFTKSGFSAKHATTWKRRRQQQFTAVVGKEPAPGEQPVAGAESLAEESMAAESVSDPAKTNSAES